MVNQEQVQKALDELGEVIPAPEVNKASTDDLDQPEGSDLGGGHMKEKLSSKAPAAEKSPKKESLRQHPTEPLKRSDAEDEDEDEGEEKEEKSFSTGLPAEVQTKIEVSDFLKSLVDHTGEAIDGLREVVYKSDVINQGRYDELLDAVDGIQQAQAKVGIVLKAICEKIGIIGNAPAVEPKAETVAKSADQPNAKAVERVFHSGMQDGDKPVFKSLSENPQIAKSQITNALCELVKKGEATDMDVIGFESAHHIRPEMVDKLQKLL